VILRDDALTFAFVCGTVGILLTEMAIWPIFVMHCPNWYPVHKLSG